ncbi:hypothetical protein DCAR_0311525 [Daucus carota subsp. sativus]|uniref:Receptor ligand binding region domain-containing protein n=1 Tax=Daucus carota subsp. sativus TaxID=79200 RepID=A0AAF0WMB5_DAUCS|nr:hypothetical protein DCAR_0311525 [Daucus carota subsp. sativus]
MSKVQLREGEGDYISLNIQKEESKKKEVHVEDNLCINPLKETELILYGGEFYNGNKTYVYGDLYRYDVDKNEWKLISSPNSPPPRSAHQAVAWKNYLYIYGGEFTSPNQERFHHYKDFWMLDLKTNQWEQLNYKGCPSPRSGHQMRRYHTDLHLSSFSQKRPNQILSPYFIQMAGADSSQLKAIASIFKGFGWKEVIFVYEDTGYQDGLIQYLKEELLKLKSASSRVFLVHMAPPLGS